MLSVVVYTAPDGQLWTGCVHTTSAKFSLQDGRPLPLLPLSMRLAAATQGDSCAAGAGGGLGWLAGQLVSRHQQHASRQHTLQQQLAATHRKPGCRAAVLPVLVVGCDVQAPPAAATAQHAMERSIMPQKLHTVYNATADERLAGSASSAVPSIVCCEAVQGSHA